MTRLTIKALQKQRDDGEKIAMLTCYDASFAAMLDAAGLDSLLVGDSLGMVLQGHETTLPVTLADMVYHTRCVARGSKRAFLVADMPFGSYQASVADGIRSVCRMVKKTGCDCVKLEVAPRHVELVGSLADAGVAVMAHLGLRPQTVSLLGGYKAQGRTRPAADAIVEQAMAFERAGAVAILLEAVPPAVSEQVVNTVGVPVVGCGAGPACHAHVVVTHDMLKLTPRAPKFVPVLADVAAGMKAAFAGYMQQIEKQQYPGPEHAYTMQHDQGNR